MKFKYTAMRDQSGRKLQKSPLLAIRLAYGDRQLPKVVGLVDTGAVDCLFDAELADELGIDLESGEEREYYGISGDSVVGYVHPVRMQLHGFNEWIEIDAAFIDGLPTNLLGQADFMDNYEITLRRYRGRFEVKSRTFLHR